MESRGRPGGPILNGCGAGGSGFSPRNKFPVLPVSGVKNPAPVAVGTCFVGAPSKFFRLLGGGRGGNSTSISGIDPGGVGR
jgi:hypothetical protein